MTYNLLSYPSPNYNERMGTPIDTIILHYTNMANAEAALQRLCDPKTEVSAHYLIDKEGRIYQLVPEEKRAWHAGISSWQGESNINCRSIGIELDNLGHQESSKGQAPLEPFSPALMDALLWLLKDITKRHIYIPPHRILGHCDVAPLRKRDPGEHFDWGLLARHGFGLILPPDRIEEVLSSLNPKHVQHLLKEIGYGCPETRVFDEDTLKVISIFREHFQWFKRI